MWFQAAECNAVNASLLLNLINNNFLIIVIFFDRESSHFESLLPPKSETLRPHPSNSIENATPSSGKSPLASCKGVPPPPRGYWRANEQEWIHYPYDVAICFRFLLTF